MRQILLCLVALSSASFGQDMPTDEQLAWIKLHAPNGMDIWADGTWVTAGSETSGSDYGMRLEDLMNQTGNYRTIWMRGDHRSDKSVPYRTTKMRVSFNCEQQTYSVGTTVRYKEDGSVYPWPNPSPRTMDVVPGSVAEEWLRIACWK